MEDRRDSVDSDDSLGALLEAELEAALAGDGSAEGEEDGTASDAPAAKRARVGGAAAPPCGAAAAVCPPHPGFMGGICIRCGALKDEAEEQGVALSYIHRGLEVSKHEAERVRQGTADRLLAGRKLLLILDLE
jgi:RNA polymerase II C-terminal domain phosphatase-like 3/4